jgi:hypothetical protein
VPPLSGFIRFDAGSPYSAVTKVRVSINAQDGNDVYWGLMLTQIGSRLLIQDTTSHTTFAEFETTADPVDLTSYIEFSVTFIAQGTALSNNETVLLRIGNPVTNRPPIQHHTTHEPGGTDMITALDAAVLTTGTMPDARLSGNVVLEDAYNVFTVWQQFSGPVSMYGGLQLQRADPNIQLQDTSAPADAKMFAIFNTQQELFFTAYSDAMVTQAIPLRLQRTGNAIVAGTLTAAGLGATPLNATNLTSGTVPDARLSANVVLKPMAAVDLPAHALSHKAGGADAIKLDELAAPTDVLTLNASLTAHGLLQKLPGGTTTFLRGDGTFAAPAAAPVVPGGSDTQVQFNDAGVLGGDSGLTFNKTTDVLSAGAVAAGPTPALSGAIRLGNFRAINFRNAANNGDVQALTVDSSNRIVLADPVWISGADPSLTLGSTAAQTGAIRLLATRSVSSRNLANSGDVPLISLGAADTVVLGNGGPVSVPGSLTVTGTITAAGLSTTPLNGANLTNDSVTYAKLPNVTASKLLGRGASAAGDPEEITLGTGLSITGTTLNAVAGGSTPGGATTQVQFNDGGVLAGDAGLTYAKATDVLTVATAVAAGPLPAGGGPIRIPNGLAVTSRNSVNTDDVSLIGAGPDNAVYIGYIGATHTWLYPQTVAIGAQCSLTGAIRIQNAGGLTARNASNNADLSMIYAGNDNKIAVGEAANDGGLMLRSAVDVTIRPAGAGANDTVFSSTAVVPFTTNKLDLGSSAKRWKDGYFSGTVLAAGLGATPLNAANLADDSITYAKLPNVAVSKLLGRGSAAGAGDPQEITLGTNLTMSGTTLNAAGAAAVVPGGATTQVQFNDGGAFAGSALFTFAKADGTLTSGVHRISAPSYPRLFLNSTALAADSRMWDFCVIPDGSLALRPVDDAVTVAQTSPLTLLRSGAVQIQNELVYGGNGVIRNTVDTGRLMIGSGGDVVATRGPLIQMYGSGYGSGISNNTYFDGGGSWFWRNASYATLMSLNGTGGFQITNSAGYVLFTVDGPAGWTSALGPLSLTGSGTLNLNAAPYVIQLNGNGGALNLCGGLGKDTASGAWMELRGAAIAGMAGAAILHLGDTTTADFKVWHGNGTQIWNFGYLGSGGVVTYQTGPHFIFNDAGTGANYIEFQRGAGIYGQIGNGAGLGTGWDYFAIRGVSTGLVLLSDTNLVFAPPIWNSGVPGINGNVLVQSDGRLVRVTGATRTNVTSAQSLNGERELALRLRPVAYRRDAHEGFGFLADEVEAVDPRFVTQLGGGETHLDLGSIVAVLTATVQRLHARIHDLEARMH